MHLLQRYFLSQALLPLILCLSALAGLALLTQSLQTLDLIVENRQSAITFLYITILALPQLIAIILPLAVFMAVLYALNRLNMDSEMIVARASGITPWQIATPVIRLGVYAMIIHLIINLVIQPFAFREMRAEILKVRTDIASQMVQAGRFVTPTPNLTVYAREIGSDGSLLDVLIHDARDAGLETTHTAKYGIIQTQNNSASIILKIGNVQQRQANGNINNIGFDNYQIDMSDVVATDNVLRLKTSDRYLHELLKPDPREYITRKIKRERFAEGHSRMAAPLYNLALPLLALCFMLSGQHLRLGYARPIAICAALGFAMRIAGFALTASAEGNSAFNIAQYLLPLGLIMTCLFILIFPQFKEQKQYLERHTSPNDGVENLRLS